MNEAIIVQWKAAVNNTINEENAGLYLVLIV